MDDDQDNVIDFKPRTPQSVRAPEHDQRDYILSLEHEVAELRHTISVLAVERVRSYGWANHVGNLMVTKSPDLLHLFAPIDCIDLN